MPNRLCLLLVACLLAASSPHSAQAQSSPFLQDPDRFIPFVQESADFWRGVHDEANGGFFTNVSREGRLITAWGTNKDVLTQSRNLYAMVRAFQLTGDTSYLDLAESAFRFMTEHGWDETYGGWFNGLSTSGNVLNVNGQKTAFIQHYAVLGPLAYAEATDDSTAWKWVNTSMDYLDNVLWDTTPGREGYFDWVSRTGSFRTGKSFNATVDALTTHALALWMMTGDERYRERLVALSDNILEHLVASMPDQAIGFAEKYDTNWRPVEDERITIMGHVLKTAWVLGRTHQLLPDEARVAAARQLVDHVLEKGYDHEYGGPYKDFDRVNGQMQMYGLSDSTKAWWQMEQAFTSGLELYRTTGDSRYLDMADETVTFFMDYFVDPVYGEVYADRTRRGGDIPQWGDHKGNGYKAAYHSVEFGWYGYLYGHLTLQGTPATVYYRMDARNEDRTVALAPLERDPSSGYVIRHVTLDGTTWTGFDPAARTLSIPAGTSGTFAVDFGEPANVAVESAQPISPLLADVWPNPAQDRVNIRLVDVNTRSVEWQVIDALGRSVATGSLSASGSPELRWTVPTDHLPAGVYTLIVSHERGRVSKSIAVVR